MVLIVIVQSDGDDENKNDIQFLQEMLAECISEQNYMSQAGQK